MTAPDEIDWERKFQEQVSDNIRHRQVTSRKLTDAQLELDQAKRRIAELEKQVKALTPAGDRMADLQKRLADQAEEFARRRLRDNARVREAEAKVARGQRAVIESVVAWLQETADKLPEPEMKETEPS
jgi:predicted  nucleic acid-binding Zn-ribbon protein